MRTTLANDDRPRWLTPVKNSWWVPGPSPLRKAAVSRSETVSEGVLQLPPGGLTFLFECGELRPQLVERDEPLGGHILKAGAFVVCRS